MSDKKHVGNSGGREFPTQKENLDAIRFLEEEARRMNAQIAQRLREEKGTHKRGGENKG